MCAHVCVSVLVCVCVCVCVCRPMTTAASGVMQVNNEFNEFRGTDPRLTDEPFQLTAQEWSKYMKHHVSPMTAYAVLSKEVFCIKCVLYRYSL